jgi:cyclophilin family peptidyl-prolyl cis-trans isomerase
MKKTVYFSLIFIVFGFSVSCSQINSEKDSFIIIETEFGNMKVKLYNETPKHRDNFIKLTEKGFFDDLLFHRVINGFMIQGGDPDSKNALQGKMLGDGGPGYDIDAEFNENLFHKKGVIAAARESDQVNPEKKSSGSQFYIVQGRKMTDEEMNQMEQKVNESKRNTRIQNAVMNDMNLMKKVDSLQSTGNTAELNKIIEGLGKKIDETYKNEAKYTIPEDHRKMYREIGGTPFLDGSYTVFGEVVEGLDIIDKIAAAQTDKNDRPEKDIKMKIKLVK